MKFGTLVKQSQLFNCDYFHENWCLIFDFMGFWIWKMYVVALTFVKFELLSLIYTWICYVDQGTFVLNLSKIDWSVQIFLDFEFFENFFKCLTQTNFNLLSWNFVRECTNTEWYDTKFYENQKRPLNFRRF